MKESPYALLLVLLLAVTKASIKVARNQASAVCQRKVQSIYACNMNRDQTNTATFTHKTTHIDIVNRQMLKIKRLCRRTKRRRVIFPPPNEKPRFKTT